MSCEIDVEDILVDELEGLVYKQVYCWEICEDHVYLYDWIEKNIKSNTERNTSNAKKSVAIVALGWRTVEDLYCKKKPKSHCTAEFQILLLSMCTAAQESTTSLLSSGFVPDGAGEHQTSEGE